MNLTPRDGLHLGLLVVTLAGLGVACLLIVKSASNQITDQSFFSSATDVWSGILQEIPASMPGDYPDDESAGEITEIDDLSPSQANRYVGNNSFILTCTFLVILGCFGLALQCLSSSIQEPWWNCFLRTGTVLTIAFTSFLLWGFSLAFPYDHFGIFPLFSFNLPGSVNPVEYGLEGISEWTDLIYIASYAAFIGCVVVAFSAAGQTTKSSLLIAIPILSFLFPIVLSWKWGAGWIDLIGNNSDFAGASLVHWHVGVVALLIGAVLTFYRRSKGYPTLPHPAPIIYVAGGIFYFVGVIGLNAGSTLTAKPDLVAAVLQCTVVAAASSGVITSVTCIATGQGNLVRFFIVGLLAGAVSISGGADGFSLNQSIAIGSIAGVFVSGALILFERLNWADPMALGAIHGVGGFVAVFATCVSTFDDGFQVTIWGQLLLLITVPLLSLIVTGVILLFAGATNLLIYEKKPKPVPPSLPGAP